MAERAASRTIVCIESKEECSKASKRSFSETKAKTTGMNRSFQLSRPPEGCPPECGLITQQLPLQELPQRELLQREQLPLQREQPLPQQA